MKTFPILGILLLLFSFLSAQDRVLVDCIHGADYRVSWDTYIPEAIDFEAFFPECEVDVFSADSLFLVNVYYDETHEGSQQLNYSIDLPEMVPGNTSTLYAVVENESGGYLNKGIGTISNPEGDIVAEVFNGVAHADVAYGAGWSVELNLPEEETYHIKIGWGPAMFAGPFFLSQCHLEDYDAVVKLADQSYFGYLGISPDYSDIDIFGLTEELRNGANFLMVNNFFDAFLDKPFVHFDSKDRMDIDFEVTYPGMTTIASPTPELKLGERGENIVSWQNHNLQLQVDNEIVYEAKLNSKLNFLNFDMQGDRLNIQNLVGEDIHNLKLFQYLETGVFKISEIEKVRGLAEMRSETWQQISSSELRKKLKETFYSESLEYGLSEEEAYNFVYEYNWIEALMFRAQNNPEQYFGMYHFGKELYDKLIPYSCVPAPQEAKRNMWVMLSGIQPRNQEDVIDFPNTYNLSTVESADFIMNEYGVIDEYYSREKSSRDLDFFGIQQESFINYWMMGNVDFYDNTIAAEISEGVSLDQFSQGHNTYLLDEGITGLIYQVEQDLPLAVYTQVQEEGRIIVLGSDEYFNGSANNQLLLNNMMSYLCQGSVGNEQEEVPAPEYNLSCYPNPFNPSTEIKFSINSENTENTGIEIFNIKGQKVFTLRDPALMDCIDGRQGNTNYSVTWYGTDQANNPVSSGVYFYQLKIGHEVKAQKKMVLIK